MLFNITQILLLPILLFFEIFDSALQIIAPLFVSSFKNIHVVGIKPIPFYEGIMKFLYR